MGVARDGVTYETVTYWRRKLASPTSPTALQEAVREAEGARPHSMSSPVEIEAMPDGLRVSVAIARETSDVKPGSRGMPMRQSDVMPAQ